MFDLETGRQSSFLKGTIFIPKGLLVAGKEDVPGLEVEGPASSPVEASVFETKPEQMS